MPVGTAGVHVCVHLLTGWRLVVGGGWRLAVGSWWQLAAVVGWRLVALGGWRLVVLGGCPQGPFLAQKKILAA